MIGRVNSRRALLLSERSSGKGFAGTRYEVMRNWHETVELGLQNGICSYVFNLAHSENWKRFLNVFTPHSEISLRDGHLKRFETEQTLSFTSSQPSGCLQCIAAS